jgi:hypothetical protein
MNYAQSEKHARRVRMQFQETQSPNHLITQFLNHSNVRLHHRFFHS